MNCRAKEKLAIANYVSILELAKEIPERKYNKKTFIEALGKVEVKLDDEDEDACAKRRMEQARTKDKGAMAAIIDETFENASNNADNRATSVEIDMGGDDIAAEGDKEDCEDEDGDQCQNIEDNDSNGTIDEKNDGDIACLISRTGKKVAC